MGWTTVVTGGLRIGEIPGDEVIPILNEPRVRVLAERLCECLAAAVRPRRDCEPASSPALSSN